MIGTPARLRERRQSGLRACAWLIGLALTGPHAMAAPEWPQTDPEPRDPALFDPRRPLSKEMQLSVAGQFTLALAGDLIIARPLTRAAPVPGFDSLLSVIRQSDASFGNLETSLIDIRHFAGAPYPFEGDWANIGIPEVAADIRRMGFDLVGRANNHALDWGLEGMRETNHHLDEAGIAHAGSGETAALALAPAYYETPKGRVALVSFAMTFRPASEAMMPHGTAPGRAGISALHLQQIVHVKKAAMTSLAAANCAMNGRTCEAAPDSLVFAGIRYVADETNFNEFVPDEADLAGIGRSIREAHQHADLVLVAVHSHQCDWDCDSGPGPQLPAAVLKTIARGAIDAGADVFAATGIHNLGPIEIYRDRPIFYGLSNFFWSDIQEPVPQELFSINRSLLERAYRHPDSATDYDLTAPLNAGSFATAQTFQSVLAQVGFSGSRLQFIKLYPVSLGYGDNLRTSGTPRLEPDMRAARAIFQQIADRTTAYGLPAPHFEIDRNIALIRAP